MSPRISSSLAGIPGDIPEACGRISGATLEPSCRVHGATQESSSRIADALCRAFALFLLLPLLAACGADGRDQDAAGTGEAQAAVVPGVEAALAPGIPDPEAGHRLGWSPYGKQLPLVASEQGMDTEISLGPNGPPFRLRLSRSGRSPYYDELAIDRNHDGEFAADEILETTPSETRNKFWSSFETSLEVPVVDPSSGELTGNPYPLSFWYVEDPRIEEQEMVIRFSRRGWMEGVVTLDGREAAVLVTENAMDGVFDREDSWALAPMDSADLVLSSSNARSLDEHAWLGEKAYRVEKVDPSGRLLVIAPTDPGMTRAEEAEINDYLAVDRAAARSGRTVAFLHDFEEAEAQARREGMTLLVDFETVWCGPCKIMDEWVWTADAVVDATAAMVAVKVDGDDRLDLKERFGVDGFPTMILVGPGGEELARASGYVNVESMTGFLGSGS